MAAALAGVIHGCQGTDNHKSLTPALSRDAAAFGKFQSASAALAAANRTASSLSGPSHFGGAAGGGRTLKARDDFHCWRGALDHGRDRDAVCLCNQSVCHRMAVRRREAKIAHAAMVRARMGMVRCGSRQNVALGRETR